MAKIKRAFPSVQAWMEATGTNQSELAQRLGVSQPHLCNVLSKTRKASLTLAFRISRLTNVPVEAIVDIDATFADSVK